MSKIHLYKDISINWIGNKGEGTKNYTSYSRNYQVQSLHKPIIEGSSDPAFLGDPLKYNPEEFLIISLATCHMLWFLHLCSAENIVVQKYEDNPTATMLETADGAGYFTEVILNPTIVITNPQITTKNIEDLHAKAHKYCFIANSVNFSLNFKSTVSYQI